MWAGQFPRAPQLSQQQHVSEILLREYDYQEQSCADMAKFVCDSYHNLVYREDYMLANVLVQDLIKQICST